MLARQIERVHQARSLDELIVATSSDASDDAIAMECDRNAVECSRGSLEDVLDRVYRAVAPTAATAVVRLTGDCPLTCPDIIDAVVAFREAGGYDYASNVLEPTFPDGMDVEAMTRAALEAAWSQARLPSEREHVTPYLWKHPERFRSGSYRCTADHSAHRWTVDESADYALVSAIFERLYLGNPSFRMADILQLLQSEPALQRLNADIPRNAGYLKSIAGDRLMSAADDGAESG